MTMTNTVSRTWWISDSPLEEIDLEFFAERVERSGDPRLRMSVEDGRVALNSAAVDFLLRESDGEPPYVYGSVHRYGDAGFSLSTPDGVVPLRKVVKSRPARDGETSGEVW